MQVRAIGSVLALAVSTALVSPAQAQQTALPDLPTIGERLAPYKESYEDIKALSKQVEQAHQQAAQEAVAAQNAYRNAFAAHQNNIDQAARIMEAARTAKSNAEENYRASIKSDRKRQYRPGSEDAKRQARETAETERLKAIWDGSKIEYVSAKKVHDDLLLSDPLVELLARMGIAQTYEQRALTNLTNVEELLLQTTGTYVEEMLKYPPPYLSKIEVGDGTTTYYAASWEIAEDGEAGSTANRDALLKIEGELKADLREMDEILEAHALQRRTLAQSMRGAAATIVGQANSIENLEWAKALAPIVIDSTAFVVDLLTTGGATTATDTVTDAIARTAIERAFLKNPRAANAINAMVSKEVSAITTEALNQKAGGKQVGSALDDFVSHETGISNSGASIVLSDAIETSIGAGLGNATDPVRWRLIKGGGQVGSIGRGYLNSMKKAAPAAIITSLSKAAVNKLISDRLDSTRKAFVQANFEFEVSSQLFSQSLLADREMIELRKQLRASLAAVQFQLALEGRSPVLVKKLDQGVPAKTLRDGKLTIRAFFNQPMSVEPILKFGDDFLLDWQQIRERDGTQWIGTKLSGTSFEGDNKVQLFVAASKGNDGHDSLDGRPSTVPELDFVEAKWTNFEQLADGNHVVKIAHPETDLTGLWRRNDGTLFRFTHTGSRLESDYASRPARFAHEIGGINFNGTIAGNRVTGRLLGRPQRVHYQRCKLDMFEDFSFTLSDDLMTLSGTHGRSSYNTSNCRITSRDTMQTSYTRVLDEEGEPQR